MAKKKQRRPPKITDQKREEMFQAFCEKQTIRYVAKKCRVSRPTVCRYLDEDNWIERLDKIRDQARKRVDKDLVKMRAEEIALGTLLCGKGAKFVRENDFTQEAVAVQAIGLGVKIRREAAGLPGETSEQKVVIELVDGSSETTT